MTPMHFQELLLESAGYLLDESFLDIDGHFSNLLSSRYVCITEVERC